MSLLSWSPCGSYLLAGHPSGDFRVWQTQSWWPLKWSAAEGGAGAAGGRGRVRAGPGLGGGGWLVCGWVGKWQADGRAVLPVCAAPFGTLLLLQRAEPRCKQARWPPAAPAAGGLAGAAWSPDSRTLLLAYAGAPQQLVALHFTAEPPSLQAQLLPVALPEIAGRGGCTGRAGGERPCGRAGRHLARTLPGHFDAHSSLPLTGLWACGCVPAAGRHTFHPMSPRPAPSSPAANGSSRGGGSGSAVVEAMAWDPRAQRLAVAVGGAHPAAGRVALYDTRCDPILSARFIGFISAGPPGEGAEAAGGSTGAGASSDKASSAPARLAFQPSFGQGALLAVRRGGFIATLPLYFS